MLPIATTLILATVAAAVDALSFNVTATSAKDGASTFECWQLDTPPVVSQQDGLQGTMSQILGEVSSNITYNLLPAGFQEPLHPAPSNQWVVLLKGVIIVILPETNETWTAEAGSHGLMFASDTSDVSCLGHWGTVITESVILQIPALDGEIPKHEVLHTGPCLAKEMSGLSDSE